MHNTSYRAFASKSLPLKLILGRSFGILVCILLSCCFLMAQSKKEKDQPYEDFDKSKFDENSINIDNDWMSLKPGMRYVYAGTTVEEEGDDPIPHRVLIQVTDLVKEINGVKSVVTYDLDYSAGNLVEAEIAFFAQDKEGNVWRMGEYPEEYDEEGVFEAAPCWLAGIEDAVAGISMLANPWVGTPSYSQGWGPKVDFTDRGEVHKMGESTCTPMGCYDDVLVISETSEDEPGIFQLKYWVQGVGNVQVGFKGDDPSQELLELVDVLQLGKDGLADIREKALELEKNAYSRKKSKKVFGPTSPCEVRK